MVRGMRGIRREQSPVTDLKGVQGRWLAMEGETDTGTELGWGKQGAELTLSAFRIKCPK